MSLVTLTFADTETALLLLPHAVNATALTTSDKTRIAINANFFSSYFLPPAAHLIFSLIPLNGENDYRFFGKERP